MDNTCYLTLRKSLQVMDILESKGFKEDSEKSYITNTEEDEEFMVLINKESKTFKYIDHKYLMGLLKNQNVQITELKKIEQWQQQK